MSIFVIAETHVRDQEKFDREFVPLAASILNECHGEHLARGYENAIRVYGDPPQDRVVLVRFPDIDLFNTWLDKIEPAIEKVGSKYADIRIFAIDGSFVIGRVS
jgi:uncharacterized protein (DUF1330 family)